MTAAQHDRTPGLLEQSEHPECCVKGDVAGARRLARPLTIAQLQAARDELAWFQSMITQQQPSAADPTKSAGQPSQGAEATITQTQELGEPHSRPAHHEHAAGQVKHAPHPDPAPARTTHYIKAVAEAVRILGKGQDASQAAFANAAQSKAQAGQFQEAHVRAVAKALEQQKFSQSARTTAVQTKAQTEQDQVVRAQAVAEALLREEEEAKNAQQAKLESKRRKQARKRAKEKSKREQASPLESPSKRIPACTFASANICGFLCS